MSRLVTFCSGQDSIVRPEIHFRPETRENDVTVTYSPGIESRSARDSNAIVIVGHLCHVLALQHSAWNKENCQSLVHEVGQGSAQGTVGRATAGEYCSAA